MDGCAQGRSSVRPDAHQAAASPCSLYSQAHPPAAASQRVPPFPRLTASRAMMRPASRSPSAAAAGCAQLSASVMVCWPTRASFSNTLHRPAPSGCVPAVAAATSGKADSLLNSAAAAESTSRSVEPICLQEAQAGAA